MKRVLIFSLNYYPRFIGGAEVAIKEITDRIEDIEFHMVTLRFDSSLPEVEKVGNVLVHRIGFVTKNPSISDLRRFPLHLNKHYFQIAAALKAMSLNRIYRYDGTWAMMAHSCGIPAGIFKFFNPKVPYLLTLQEGDPPEAIERMMRPVFPLFRNAFKSADYLQAISNFLLAWGMRMGFEGKGTVIPNAVDTAHFGAKPSEDAVMREKARIGKKPGDVFLVTTSRLVPKNAVDTVIEALPSLPENVQFAVYGIGPDEDALKVLANRLKVASRVHFMGQISHADMPSTLAACDIFIRPSRSEGMGNSFVEAMAAGLPVIATQEGGIADFLFDAKRNPEKETTGWAVDADAPQQVAAAVTEILSNPEQVAKVTATARRMAVEKYDWSLIARNMQDLFRRMLAIH
ncbi:MAG: glycosyltransferase family 4 protein [Candidatus Pacebacteria bacterium]|nr:glycosyltransferase family 4 protein [Candidatus Paceibacterota bacterium]